MTARDLALAELDQRLLPGWPTQELRPSRAKLPTDLRDLGLAEQIRVGVVKNHFYLLHLIEHYSGRKLKSVDTLVQKILSIAMYQLHFLDRIPTSAAVNEAVEQAKRFGRSKAAGFVNAVLRKASTVPAPRPPDLQHAKIVKTREYARTFLSHPRELFDRLEKLLGPDNALRFCEHDNREPPTIVRLSADATPAQLEAPGIVVTPHERSGSYVVDPAKKSLLSDWSDRNVAQVQDPTASDVVEHCPIAPGQTVIDRCAGLGTKTLQLLAKVGTAGSVAAMDPSAERCRVLRALLRKRNIPNISVHEAGMIAHVPELPCRAFAAALVDVPCSNSGVLARRPEARYAQDAPALIGLAELQTRILDDTAGHVAAGGCLIYSTCSVWPEENEGQVEQFLKRHPEFSLEDSKSTLPSFSPDPSKYHDGGYWAVLRKRPG